MFGIAQQFSEEGLTKKVLERVFFLAFGVWAMFFIMDHMASTWATVIASLLAVGTALSSSLPRWALLWYERRHFLIEITFGGVSWLLSGGAGGIGLVNFMFASTAAVSFIKMLNARRGTLKGETFYQYLLKSRFHWLFAYGFRPMDKNWRWPSTRVEDEDGVHYEFEKAGFLDWKYLLGHWRNRSIKGYDYWVTPEVHPMPPLWMKYVNSSQYWLAVDDHNASMASSQHMTQLVGVRNEAVKKLEELLSNKPSNKNQNSVWIARMHRLQILIDSLNTQIEGIK